MAENDQNVKVVKVRPYPIRCQLKHADGSAPISCEIMRLEIMGFIFKAQNRYFKTGDEYTCEFELPVLHKKVSELVKVIKTYEAASGGSDRPVTVQVHFKDHLHKSEDAIRQFIFKIGQKSA